MTGAFGTAGVAGPGTTGAGTDGAFARAGLAVIGVRTGPAALERRRGRPAGSSAGGGRCENGLAGETAVPAPLLDQLVTAGVRSIRDLP